MNRVGNSEAGEAVSAGSVESYQIALAAYCLVNDSGGFFIINGNETVVAPFCVCHILKYMLNSPQITKSLFAHICTEHNISLAANACSIHCSCKTEKLRYRPGIVSDSRTAVAFAFFLQSKVCLPWENSVCMSRNHNSRSIPSPFPGSQHISHLINVHL